jgi:hypothetical protein
MPECITYDPVKKMFYFGSTYKRKVVGIDEKGNPKDFTAEGQDGLWSVFGVRVDPARRILWALSSVYRGMQGFNPRNMGVSAAYKFDLETGRCLKKYVLDERPKQHNFNDLVVDHSGDVFITDDQANAIYFISHETDKLDLFVDLRNRTFPNGICLSDDGGILYFSHAEGASLLDMRTKEVSPLARKAGISLCGIDGLYFYRDSLIGIQVYEPQRVLQFRLTRNGREVDQVHIVESNNPLFDLATTGVIVNEDLFYIANSQLLKFSRDGTMFPLDKLNDICILQAKLSSAEIVN